MATLKLARYSPKALPMLILAWYALLISIGIAILQGLRKD